jgi:uncharacterized membrane protein YfcA
MILSKGAGILGLFAVVMVLSAWSMIRRRPAPDPDAGHIFHPLPLALTGLSAGMLTGLLGAGGGFLIVPALVVLAGMDMRRAVGTSLLIITVNAFIGFMGDRYVHLADHLPLLLPFLGLAIVGIVVGSRLSRTVGNARLRPLFGCFVLVMGICILFREFVR